MWQNKTNIGSWRFLTLLDSSWRLLVKNITDIDLYYHKIYFYYVEVTKFSDIRESNQWYYKML